MTFHSSRPDVVVIGAGAAGIAAAREVLAGGLSCQVLEARRRLGGRAHTDACGTPDPLDLGCEWLHSADRNVLVDVARRHGYSVDQRDPPWRKRHVQRGFNEADQEIFAAEQEAYWERFEDAARTAQETGVDRPASEFLDPHARFNGFIDAISTFYNGAPLDRVSVVDFDRYEDSSIDWRVEGGYGAMIAALGADLPVRLGCRVMSVETQGRTIRVDTDQGALDTDNVIVTVPTSVLAAGNIRFDAALDHHLHAAAGLPLGVADKLFLRMEQPEAFECDTRLIGSPERRDTGTYTLRSRGRNLVEGYFGGDYARHLEAGGLPAFVDAAQREMADAFGSDISCKLTPIIATGWASDPLSLGSYSHALPGHSDDRAALATPMDGRLFFAGEATSRNFFSTAHGAWEEGTRVGRILALAARTKSANAGSR